MTAEKQGDTDQYVLWLTISMGGRAAEHSLEMTPTLVNSPGS